MNTPLSIFSVAKSPNPDPLELFSPNSPNLMGAKYE